MFNSGLQHDRLARIFDRLIDLERGGSDHHEENHERTRLVRRDCAYCDGMGQRPGPLGMASPVPCNVCKGRGYNLLPEDWVECCDCGGTGKVIHTVGIACIPRKCTECRGKGWVPDNW